MIFETNLSADMRRRCIARVSSFKKWMPSKVYRLEDGVVQGVDHAETRRGESMFPEPGTWSDLSKFVQGIAKHLQFEVGVPIRGITEFQVHKYGPGDFFGPHRDQGSHLPDCLFTVVGGLQKAAIGGELKLHEPEERLFSLMPGQVVVFPSQVLHSGEPVVEGTKIVFVCFLFSDFGAFLARE